MSRTLLRADGTRWVLFGFSAGQELTEHTTTRHAAIQILTGECEFTAAGRVHNLKAGDFLYLPPNCVHAVKATTQFSMLLTLSEANAARLVPGPVAGITATPPLPAAA